MSEHERIDPMDLRLRLGLHIPRLAIEHRIGDRHAERAEAERLARIISARQEPFAELVEPPAALRGLDSLSFRELTAEDAREQAIPILERFHYLNSARRDSTHFGLFTGRGRLAALATLSRFDLGHVWNLISEQFGPGGRPEHLRVLSRVYAFRWAPHNSISKLLGEVVRKVRHSGDAVAGLVTYLNPNLGFTGSSYRASGWSLLCREESSGYSYLDGDYVTERQLRAFPRNASVAGGSPRVVSSRWGLIPLHIYALGWGPWRLPGDWTPSVIKGGT